MQRVRQVLADTWFACGLYVRGNELLFAMRVIFWLIGALLPAAGLLLLRSVLNLLTSSDFKAALPSLIAYLAVLLAQPVVQTVNNFLIGLLRDKAIHNTNLAIFSTLQTAATIDIYETPEYHDSTTMLRSLGTRVAANVNSAFSVLRVIVQCMSIALVLLPVNPWIPLLIGLTLLPQLLLQDQTAALAFLGVISRTPEERQLQYLRQLMFDDQQAMETRFFGLLPYLNQKHADAHQSVLNTEVHFYKKQTWLTCGVAAVSWLGTAASLAIAVHQFSVGAGMPGDIAMVLAAVAQLSTQVGALGLSYGLMSSCSLYVGQYRQLLSIIAPFADKNSEGICLEKPITSLNLVNVSFHYPGSEREVLSHINLSLRCGETVALVGANGAGKTTLAKLILGLYDPVVGQVLVNGKPLTMYDRASVRARMSAVFQVFGKYFLTVRENVGFGDLPQLEEDEQIKRALAKADALPFIAKLPDGLDAQLGKRFGGHELSGGEWQKLALARSLLKAEADVLVLDEPSAALDADTEYHLYLRFKEMIANRIGVLISHRFSTVRMADRIVVLDGGTIVEEGTHEELLALDGLYARMYHQQTDRYTEAEGAY